MKFTDHKISTLEDGQYSDEGCAGLVLRVGKKAKVFYANIRVGEKRIMKKLGTTTKITVSNARGMVHAMRDLGALPEEKKKSPPAAEAFKVSDLLNEFRNKYFNQIRARTAKDYQVALEWAYDRIGDVLADSIDAHICQRLYDAIPGAGTMANRYLATMRRAWNIGIKWGYVNKNPWQQIVKKKEKPREAYAKADELRKIMIAIEQEDNPRIRAFFYLIITTACRRGEAQKMKWADIQNGIWTKPITKNGKAQRISLSQKTIDHIMAIPKGKDSDNIFNKVSDSPWMRIKKNAGVEGYTVHDLRRSIAIELLKEKKLPIKDISNLLGHTSVAITERIYAPYMGDNKDAISAVGDIFKP
jgi:integrase